MADTASINTNEDQEHQSAFVRTFLIVLAALILFTLFCMVMGRILGAQAKGVEGDPILKADIANRLAPVGSVRTTADADADGGAAATQVAAVQSGEEIVQGVCAACHISGVGGAPLLDDEAAWASRREAGLDALTASVINGKGAMPARAGTQLSDDELRRAVAAMAGIEIEDAAAAAEQTDAAVTDSAATSEAAASETEASGSGEATDAGAEENTAQASNTDATDTSGATAADTETASTATAAVVQNDAAQGSIVAAELNDRIRNVTDGICVACHLSGVGGAPKVGDKAAWAARAEKGLAGMVAVVAAGKGAMPARGGSDLNDEELAAAINYLMDK